MHEFFNFYEGHLNNVVFYYAVIIMSSYVLLAVLSSLELKMYMRKNSYVNYRDILASPLAPSISILAPAYNEEASIIDNVRSLPRNRRKIEVS